MRIAVVSLPLRGNWDERSVIVRRLAGALACVGDVELLIPGDHAATHRDGALVVRTFAALPAEPEKRTALMELVFGPSRTRHGLECHCTAKIFADAASSLSLPMQEELVHLGGGRSPALLEHLRDGDHDLVVLCDSTAASTRDAVAVLPEATPVVLVPMSSSDPLEALEIHDDVYARADHLVVVTEEEQARVQARPVVVGKPLSNLRFVLRVHDLVWRNEPLGFDDTPTVVIPRAWERSEETDHLVRLAFDVQQSFGGRLRVRLVGPGCDLLPGEIQGPHAHSRLDIWRWCSRALAVLDPEPGRLLGREALEAMMYGTPIVVPHAPGATLEHARVGSGGLWYRTEAELEACLEALLDPEVRKPLGEQARSYAIDRYGDTDRYITAVGELVSRTLS